jgi:hypothetical protein
MMVLVIALEVAIMLTDPMAGKLTCRTSDASWKPESIQQVNILGL